jgi:hypothetical protein
MYSSSIAHIARFIALPLISIRVFNYAHTSGSCADASNSDNLHRNIFDTVMLHQLFEIIRKCFSIFPKAFLYNLIMFCAFYTRPMKNKWGISLIRTLPFSTLVSFGKSSSRTAFVICFCTIFFHFLD